MDGVPGGFGGRDSYDSAQIEHVVDKGKDIGPGGKGSLKVDVPDSFPKEKDPS